MQTLRSDHECPESEVRQIMQHTLKKLQIQSGNTGNIMILLWFVDLKFLSEHAAKNNRNFKSTALERSVSQRIHHGIEGPLGQNLRHSSKEDESGHSAL